MSRPLAQGRSKLGDYLAHCAHLESASVPAFERLASELRAHGAPSELVEDSLAARDDEVRHAHDIGRLARAHGGEPVPASVTSMPLRTLEEIALENAVEGCVRETYGALLGSYQAMHAGDPLLREAMAQVAQDEARHAALSHRVQRWIVPRLSHEARERVLQAQQRAVFELIAETQGAPLDAELCAEAGLPPARVSRLLLAELSRTLWSSAPHASAARRAVG